MAFFGTGRVPADGRLTIDPIFRVQLVTSDWSRTVPKVTVL
jgi:hypothetical protein